MTIANALNSARHWRDAVIYQIYPKSFADASGDGIGDINGIRAHLDYVASLGVDAVWVSPWYTSPMNDGGYDISDYLRVDPAFGTNEDAAAFIDACHERGLRVLLDLVANHCSIEHPWFTAALASAPGSSARAKFYFLDGRGEGGGEPPTDWISVFGGSAWTHESTVGGEGNQWYLNIFDSSQPDLNWSNPAVVEAFDGIITFWFDLGVDGFRLDAIPAMGKDWPFSDVGFAPGTIWDCKNWDHMPFWDAPGVHPLMRRWRSLADRYDPPKHLIGEVLVGSHQRLANYVSDGELQSVFSIGVSTVAWEADAYRDFVNSMASAIPVAHSWLTWTLSSHDEVRTVTRVAPRLEDGTLDLERGRARSRALHLLLFALPGAACLYQGEELGLEQVRDIPDELLQDPIFARTGDRELARDGCRVPLPWNNGPAWGFSSTGASWLPQPATWGSVTASAQHDDPDSFLNFTRRLVAARAGLSSSWVNEVTCASQGDAVVLRRGNFWCVVNLGEAPISLTASAHVLFGTNGDTTTLAPDAAAWVIADESPLA